MVEWQVMLQSAACVLFFGTTIATSTPVPPNGRYLNRYEENSHASSTSDEFRNGTETFKCGNFIITLTQPSPLGKATSLPVAPVLEVWHPKQPSSPLWQTEPGEPFLRAAKGELTSTDESGTFLIHDEVRDECSTLVVTEGKQVNSTTATLNGTLCDDSFTVTWHTDDVDGYEHLTVDITLTASSDYNHIFLTYLRAEEEQFYGFGHQYTYFNMAGRKFPVFLTEQGIGRGLEPLTGIINRFSPGRGGHWYTSYTHQPFYITSLGHSFLLESQEYVEFDLSLKGQVVVKLAASDLRARLFVGENLLNLISSATAYTGRMRPLPPWTQGGAVLGLEGGTDAVLESMEKMKPAKGSSHDGLPISALWLQDWSGMRNFTVAGEMQRVGVWWNWEVDETLYPHWGELIGNLSKSNIRMLVYLNPMLVNITDRGTPYRNNYYEQAMKLGYAVRGADGKPWVGYSKAILVDLTNPDAVQWMKDMIFKNVLSANVSGWMCDFGEALPLDAKLHDGDGAILHNQYPTMWAKLNEEVVKGGTKSPEDVVYFMRSAGTFSASHTSLYWMGDQMVTWDAFTGIRSAIVSMLTAGVSGHSMVHTDIGGYTAIDYRLLSLHYIRSKELFMRWAELAAFTVMFRTHLGTLPAKNWQAYSDEETIEHFTRMARLYTSMAFYRIELMQEAAEHGWPVLRHMVLEFADNKELKSLDLRYEQFMLGSEVLVAPVSSAGSTNVSVWLPQGTTWTHVWTGKFYQGENKAETILAPLGQPCFFIKTGSPIAPVLWQNLKQNGLIIHPP